MFNTKKEYMMKRKSFMVSILILSLLILSGCSATLTADKNLIEKFTPQMVPSDNETLVYVIRKSQILGAGRGLHVAINDKIIANIRSGEYCYFKVDSGINTINIEQQVPSSYFRLDNRPGEVVYLYFEVTSVASWNFSEIPKNLGITAIMKSKLAKDIGKAKNNKWYPSILMNPGFLNLYLMKETNIQVEPDTENATITFVRPSSYAEDLIIGIWSENEFIGNLKAETYFQIKVPAGEYNFFGKSDLFSVVKEKVEAGKKYFVQVEATMGFIQPHIKLLPVTSDQEQEELQEWLDKDAAKHVIIDETAIDAQIKERLNLALPHINKALKKVNEGKVDRIYFHKNYDQ